MPDRMSEDMSEYMPEDMPDRMPEDMSDRVPEDMPDRMPEDLPDRMPEDMPEDMPDHMPEDMPDRMSNRMSEDMSDRMPEDLPVRKCINVMVGITRSKVIRFASFMYRSPKNKKQLPHETLVERAGSIHIALVIRGETWSSPSTQPSATSGKLSDARLRPGPVSVQIYRSNSEKLHTFVIICRIIGVNPFPNISGNEAFGMDVGLEFFVLR